MEMVLEYAIGSTPVSCEVSFNPSSNGNGAGIGQVGILEGLRGQCFNPSSNGNGAGIIWINKGVIIRKMFQSFF